MEDNGEYYYQSGIDFFENGEYEKCVREWIHAYEIGFEKELILKNLYGCFIEPNEEEYRQNYKQNSLGFTGLAYEECMLDFIPVSQEKFYIFDKESGIFKGFIELEKISDRGRKQVFDSILFADIWDFREVISDLEKNNRNCVYLLVNKSEDKLASFFKLPRLKQLYCTNIIVFRNTRIMQAFFEENEGFFIPKQFAGTGTQIHAYKELLQKIHKERVNNIHAERKDIFLTICIPRKTEREVILRIRSCLRQCFYDSEIEVLIACSGNETDTEDIRMRYFTYDEQESYVENVWKALHIAKGIFKIVIDAEEFEIWKQLGIILDALKSHGDQTVFCMHDGGLEGVAKLFTDLEWLQHIVPKSIREKQDLFMCLELKNQYIIKSFAEGERIHIAENWEESEYLIEEMKKFLDMDTAKVPVQERDQNLIVMAITQLLTPRHAPTRILLEMSRILEIYFKKKVILLSEIKEYDAATCMQAGLKEVDMLLCRKELDGKFEYPYKECCFSGYQIQLKRENRQQMQQLMQGLYDCKPYCVWCFGGVPAFAGAMKQFTSVIYTQLTEGYPGIPADMVVNYFERASDAYPQEKAFLIDKGVKVQEIRIGLSSYQKSKGLYHRSDTGTPEDAFCIGIAGNRLEEDCTDEFLKMLGQVLHRNKTNKVWLIFIGGVSDEFEKKVKECTKEESRIRFFGYCPEFADAIALTDLVVATPGLGNGGAGVTALQEGIPVVSLEVGDIASCVGKDFQCRSLEEYPALIQKYMEDSEFYEVQSKKAVNVFQSLLVDEKTVAEQVQEVLVQVKGL